MQSRANPELFLTKYILHTQIKFVNTNSTSICFMQCDLDLQPVIPEKNILPSFGNEYDCPLSTYQSG